MGLSPADETVYLSSPAVSGGPRPFATNDTAVVSASVVPRSAVAGETVNITATVLNKGDGTVTVDVNATAGQRRVGTRAVDLDASESKNVSFLWDTTGIPPTVYPIQVEARALPEESNLTDNLLGAGTVEVLPAPLVVTLTADRTATDVGLPIVFTCRPTPAGDYTFEWDFGDGLVPGDFQETKVFGSPGAKTVTCIVTDEQNTSETGRLTVMIAPIPSVLITADRTAASPERTLTFHALTTGGTGTIAYAWSFGDGEGGTRTPITHAYRNAGQYIVSVTATDAVGATATVSLTVTISDISYMVTLSTPEVERDEQVTFAAFATGGNGGPYTYVWHFGDGPTTGNGPIVTHAYSKEGIYQPSVEISDGLGVSLRVYLSEVRVATPVGASFAPPEFVAGISSAIAVGLAVGLVLMLRKRRRRRRWGPRPH